MVLDYWLETSHITLFLNYLNELMWEVNHFETSHQPPTSPTKPPTSDQRTHSDLNTLIDTF